MDLANFKTLVVGSANLDILGRPNSQSSHRDREGTVQIEVGGSACNVAVNLQRLGQQVRLLTAWGASPIERLMAGLLSVAGIDLMVDEVPGMPLAAFSAQLTADGDLESAISATPVDLHHFAPTRVAEALAGVACVVVDANLNASTLHAVAKMAKERGLPVFGLGVSEDKVGRLRGSLPLLQAAVMNGRECDSLMVDIGAVDPSHVTEETGVTLVVTRGDRGAVVYAPHAKPIGIPPPTLDGVRTLLGMGDAFSAGFIDGLVRHGKSYLDAADHANELVKEVAKLDGCNSFSLNALNDRLDVLYRDARFDRLTNLMRRPAFESEYEEHFQDGWNHALILIDCDRFKQVNDTFGHAAGDRVLHDVARAIQQSIRGGDLSCRWGGDEFVVLLPRTSTEDSLRVAERIQGMVAGMALHGVTLSVGLAMTKRGEALSSVIRCADEAMYEAKHAGRNTIVIAQDTQDAAHDTAHSG